MKELSYLLPFCSWKHSVCVVVLLMCSCCEAAVNLPENMTVPAIFTFGDSIVDQGNNNFIKTIIYCNFPPYGEDFQGGLPTGRFTNGKTPPDLIAAELGIKELIPAYSDKNLTGEDLASGVSFASGGCGYDPQTSKIVRWLRPEVFPLFAAIGVAFGICGM